ncbi:nickel pincer cofactor biosynthesis protein LarC2 [Caminicella sporogenes]
MDDKIYDKQCVIEANIDDMNPEIYSYIEEKLFEAGALDVYKTPIIMKKGRPAIKLSILVNSEHEEDIEKIIFEETTSIGIRKFGVKKVMLKRNFFKLNTKYGAVTIKNSYFNGKMVSCKPEFEDCRRIAHENNIAIKEVYREVSKLMEEYNDK